MAAASFLRAIVLAGALALGACAEKADEPAAAAAEAPDRSVANAAGPANADPPQLAPPVGASTQQACNAPKAEPFVGRRADRATRADLAAAVAPVATIRWVAPGDATTEDYSAQRLNVMLDVADKIVSVHCG